MVILRGQIVLQKVFVGVFVYHMNIYTDHRKINTCQQTQDYSFETYRQ